MYTNEIWVPLIDSLTQATLSDRLVWKAAPKQTAGSVYGSLSATTTVTFGIGAERRILSATTGGVLYELGVPEMRYVSPELKIWEQQGADYKQLATLATESEMSVGPLTRALEQLAHGVQLKVESERDIVQRLIEGLESN